MLVRNIEFRLMYSRPTVYSNEPLSGVLWAKIGGFQRPGIGSVVSKKGFVVNPQGYTVPNPAARQYLPGGRGSPHPPANQASHPGRPLIIISVGP